jgi:hypothetical protein
MGRTEILVPVIVLMLLMGFGGYVFFNQQGTSDDGDEGNGEDGASLSEWNVYSVSAVSDLPTCDSSTQARLYHVESESSFYVCKSDGWMFIDLTGETGSTGAAGQDGTTPTLIRNLAPLISISPAKNVEGTAVYSTSNGTFIGYSGYNFTIFRTVRDLDGTIANSGWDIDLDGTIDQVSTGSMSIDSLSIPETTWVHANSIIGTSVDSRYMIATIAFIAVDDDGAAAAELHSILIDIVSFGDAIDVAELAGDGELDQEGSEEPNTWNTYTADDAADDATDWNRSDTLIKLQMTGSDDLAWSFVKITISVGDNVYTCSVSAGDDCSITQSAGSNDNAWEPGEYIFLHEGGAEICSTQGCFVDISVTYNGRTVSGDSVVVVN